MPHHQSGDEPIGREGEGNPSEKLPTSSFKMQDYINLFSNKAANLASPKSKKPAPRPPPKPSKPQALVDEYPTKSGLAESGFRRYSSSSKTIIHTSTSDQGSGRAPVSHISDCDPNQSNSAIYSRDEFNQTSKIVIGETRVAKQRAPIGSLIYDSTVDPIETMNDRFGNISINSNSRAVSRPIVTESPEEFNNNIPRSRSNNTSTVEILEVPYQQRSRNGNYGNISTAPITSDHSTYVRAHKEPQNQQQPSHRNSAFATTVVTALSGDEDFDAMPTGMHVEIMNGSTHSQPPRTSTPNTTASHLGGIPSSGSDDGCGASGTSGTSTATNNNKNDLSAFRQQNIVAGDGPNPGHNDSFQTDDDVANVTRDTDELTNTSVLNQSGCELVGVNDGSDLLNNSKDSPVVLSELEKTPYIVQTFNETNMSSSVSPKFTQDQTNGHENHQFCSKKMEDLENLLRSSLGEVDRLKDQVSSLRTRVSELESIKEHFDKNQRSSYQPDSLATSGHGNAHRQHGFSKSTTTINRLQGQPAPGLNSTSTYSRSQNASRAPNSRYSSGAQQGTLSRSMYSTTNSNPRPLKKNNAYAASTSSLYTESHKSESASVSPTPYNNIVNNRQSASPTSLMSLSNRREPSAYTSMLSLTSVGQPMNSLKKGSAMSGSISNLSQIGNQLSSWPSESNFLTANDPAKDVIYDEETRIIRMILYNTLIPIRVPNHVPVDYNFERVIEPPSVKLKLDWVYGYRGRDCRSNLFHLPTGECIYFVASIVVLLNPDTKTQRHYLGHTDSVKCLAVHPNKLVIASGQSSVLNRRDKRPVVRVWNAVSLATLRVIGFNEDFDRSICCLAFSKHDQGATLAVVDESTEHTITLLDWQREKSWRIAEANSGHDPVLAIDFHPLDKYSLVAVGRSTVNFWDIRGLTLAKKAGLFDKYDKPKYVLCLTFNDFGDTITGDSNGNIIIWPRGGNRPKRVVYEAHQGGVFSVLAMKDGSYLTGGRDRRIVEWDDNFNPTGREAELPEHCGGVRYITCARGPQVLVGTLRNSILVGSLDTSFNLIMQGHAEATSSLAIHPMHQQYLTGGFDDQIHMFNSKTHSVLWSKCIMMPATAACFSPNGLLIVIGSTTGKWLVLDTMTKDILFTASDGSGTMSCVKFSPSGEYFCLGSSDMQTYIYQASASGNKFTRVGTCVGHSAPIKEMDWSDDSRYLQTQSMNFELLYWKADNCRPLEDPNIIDDLKWFTQNCTLGFNVIGIWPNSLDSALVNCCDKSNDDELMVSATNTGNINVFKWPTCYNECLSQKYYGNVDTFNFIKFLPDDSRLIAVGAKSCVTTEWVVDRTASR